VITERLADPVRISGQRPDDELPTGGSDHSGEFFGQAATGSPGEVDLEGRQRRMPFARNSASTWLDG
jgi:hypothetical protein